MEGYCETDTSDLNFYGSDPGAVKFGNFINYYAFHAVEERVNNLNPLMFPTPVNNRLVCLDIGCNTGKLTASVYEYLKNIYPNCSVHVLAVDIDPTLIHRAKIANHNPNITFSTCDIMALNNCLLIQNYLQTHATSIFDITFCFSVTMWIHLNNGDEGLIEFLKYIKTISSAILIEPQPWKCYKSAEKRLRKAGHTFYLKSLNITKNVDIIIENTLSEGSHSKIYESPSSSWERKVQSFHTISQNI